MVIKMLKERIKSLSGNMKEDKIKKELEEIETINIELDHRVTKFIAENKHLKQTYKQLYDSIKSSRIRSKVQCDDLINQVNLKSTENSDLNASLQEKVLVITALKDNLRKLKEKAIVDEAVILYPIDPEMLKVDVAPLAPKLRNNRTVHSYYIRHTQEETVTLREIVEQGRSLNPLNTSLDYACNCSKHMTGDRSQLTNFVDKFLGTLKFSNDYVAKIMGYGDYQIENVTISRVYFVDGLGHNLFSVGCRSVVGSQGNNLYTLSLGDMMASVDNISGLMVKMAYEQSSSGPALHEMTLAIINSRFVPNPTSSTPFVPPSRTDWDRLFQLMFDKLLTPLPSVNHPAPKVITLITELVALEPAASTGSPSSTTVDQDAPSPSNSQTTPEPLVSIRLQLHEQALLCYYDAFLTSVEPKKYKDALTQSCWIEAMQEELNKFEFLEVWELVPRSDKVMVITLKWIYKVKLDELG
nr:integrase, catalytic region, zinc finger, CCHC-type, peptidase aspartic, catalytic [Tanacetum cinerariifolium]